MVRHKTPGEELIEWHNAIRHHPITEYLDNMVKNDLTSKAAQTHTEGNILVDMDGTTFEYHGWTKWNEFGPPIKPMVDRIKAWIAEGKDVRIFTARMPLPQDEMKEQTCYKTGEKFNGVMMKKAIADHCEKHIGHRLRAQCYKDLNTIEIWDDRAVGVVANLGITLVDEAVAEAQALKGKTFGQGVTGL